MSVEAGRGEGNRYDGMRSVQYGVDEIEQAQQLSHAKPQWPKEAVQSSTPGIMHSKGLSTSSSGLYRTIYHSQRYLSL